MPDDEKVLFEPVEATAEWLTGVLRAKGFLTAGTVHRVERTDETSVHAHTSRLKLSYSPEATGTLPAGLFLKICKGGSALFSDSEVQYYTVIAASMPDPPIPQCCHAAYDRQTGRYHLLLHDLTETHHVNWDVPPTLSGAGKTIDALACLHAHWWDSSRLPETIGRYPDADVIERYVAHIRPGVLPLLDYMGSRLSTEDQDCIKRVFDTHPSLLQRRGSEGKHFTCIHGDPNPGNILSPYAPDGRAYLIDRQPFPWSLTTWTGVSDVAYMAVHWWESEVRQSLQEPLLRRYLAQLEAQGVEDYPWQKLWDDYRLAAMQSFYVVADWSLDPTEQKEMEWVWRPQLQKTLAAYRDLDCAEMLTAR